MNGEDVRKLREKLGFSSPTKFANALGLSHTTIYLYEKGRKIPEDKIMLFKLLDIVSDDVLVDIGLYDFED